MDGTLLNEYQKVSYENIQAIKDAQNNGIEVIVATGRSKQEALVPLNEAGLKCPIISINGAETWNVEGNVQAIKPIDLQATKKAMQLLRDHHIYFELYLGSGSYSDSKEHALDVIVKLMQTTGAVSTQKEMKRLADYRISNGSITFVDQYESLLDNEEDPVLKLLAFSTNLVILDQVEELLGKQSDLAVTASARGNLEINSIDAQKGLAVQEYAKNTGVPLDDVMGLGDNLNDLSMMKLVGYPVAMGNAAYEVKQICRYETSTNDLNGVAEAIYTHTNLARPESKV